MEESSLFHEKNGHNEHFNPDVRPSGHWDAESHIGPALLRSSRHRDLFDGNAMAGILGAAGLVLILLVVGVSCWKKKWPDARFGSQELSASRFFNNKSSMEISNG